VDEHEVDLRLALLGYVTVVAQALADAGVEIPSQEARTAGWSALGGDLFVYSLGTSDAVLRFMEVLHAQQETDEHRACIDALRRHPVIGRRLDTLVGTTFSAMRLEADRVPDRVVWALPSGPARTSVDEFDAAFDRVYSWLTRDVETFLIVAPLPEVELTDGPIALSAELEIDRLTDEEVRAGLYQRVVPMMGSGDTAHVLSRVGMRIREEFPILIGEARDDDTRLTEAQDAWGRWAKSIEDVLHLLRLHKAGTVTTPGAVAFATPDQGGYQGVPVAASSPISFVRGYDLAGSDEPALRALWDEINTPAVRKQKQLQIALRRFGFAGERIRSEDRMVDVVIAAEALFLGERRNDRIHPQAGPAKRLPTGRHS
jgi:hypothetical protein